MDTDVNQERISQWSCIDVKLLQIGVVKPSPIPESLSLDFSASLFKPIGSNVFQVQSARLSLSL